MKASFCPNCGANVEGSNFCQYCGSKIPELPEPVSTAMPITMSSPVAAPEASRVAQPVPTAMPAQSSQQALPPYEPPTQHAQSAQPAPKKGGGKKALIVVIILLIVALLFWGYAAFTRSLARKGFDDFKPDSIVGTWELTMAQGENGTILDYSESDDFFDNNLNGELDGDEILCRDLTQVFGSDGRWTCDQMTGKYGVGEGSWENITDDFFDDADMTMEEFIADFPSWNGEELTFVQFYLFDGGTDVESLGMLQVYDSCTILTEQLSNGGAWIFEMDE